MRESPWPWELLRSPASCIVCQGLRNLSLWQALPTKAAAGPRREPGMFDAQSWDSELLSFRKHFLCHVPLALLQARWPSLFLFCDCTSLSLFSLPGTSCHLSSFSSFRCHFLRVASHPIRTLTLTFSIALSDVTSSIPLFILLLCVSHHSPSPHEIEDS